MRYYLAALLFAAPSGLSAQEAIFAPGAKLKIEAQGDGGAVT